MKRAANSSYIPERHKLIRPQYEYLEGILNSHKVSQANRLYFIHVYCSNKWQKYESPIPGRTIWQRYRGAKPKELQRLGLIDLSDYWGGHCRRHRVNESIMIESLTLVNNLSSADFLIEDYICYETGRVMNRAPQPCRVSDNGHPEPDVVRRAIERLAQNGSVVNLESLDNYIGNLAYDPNDSKQKGLYINDSYCLEGIRSHRPELYDGPLSQFVGSWHALNTGRLYIHGGCLQSSSAAMKRAGYKGIRDFANYDAKSCQPFILIKEMEKANINPQPLIDYISTENYKDVYGGQVGLPGRLMKKIVIALCMGAHMPKTTKHYTERDNTVLNCLAEVAETEEQLALLLKNLWDTVGDMARAIHSWHYYLLENYINANKVRGRNGFYLPNAAGKNLSLRDLRLSHPKFRFIDVSRVAAHILQGLEAAVILSFIGEQDPATCVINSCDHDGFTVLKGQPDLALWQIITKRYGLGGLQLERKDL